MIHLENFEVRLASEEQSFIYQYGVNLGFTMSFRKVDRCYFLSSEAKQLYRNLCAYAYSGSCFPSQNALRAELGWGKQKMSAYLNELREKGFISTSQPKPEKPLIYNILPLHTIPCLFHSELLHQIRIQMGNEFYALLDEYRKSELCRQAFDRPLDFADQIHAFFQRKEPETEASQARHVPTYAPPDVDVNVESTQKKKKKARFNEISVDEWQTFHFCDFFAHLYEKKYDKPYAITKKDLGCMKRLLAAGVKKQRLKNMIELYVSTNLVQGVKTISVFSSNHTQAQLDALMVQEGTPDEFQELLEKGFSI